MDRFGRLGLTEATDVFDDLLRSWWDTAERLSWRAQEVANMQVAYPSFDPIIRRRHTDWRRVAGWNGPETARERLEREHCGELILAWRGPITPFPCDMSLTEVQAIIADLDEDRPVRLMADGVLAHYGSCGGTHQPRPEFRLVRPLHGTFNIEIAYRRPPGCPIARSRWPRIDQNHPLGPPPHVFTEIDVLCVLFPADGAWVSDVHGVRDYANYTAIWLAKHLAWEEARERGIGVQEAWPGTAASHDPFQLPRLLGPCDPCRCGSPKNYGECCAAYDEMLRKRTPRRRA